MKTPDPDRPNPFPGLRPFRSDEHHLFFGREEQTAALLQLLRTNRFLAVVGTSGSGKSSLVRAGMIAELHGGTMTRAGSTWEVMILRPGGSPVENLARAFVEADLYDADNPSTLPRLLATLNRSRYGLVEAMKQSEPFGPGTNLLVVVDQFEELFRFRQQGVDSEEAATAFVNLLLTASEQAECPIYVAITMRSDYLGDCSEIPGLAEAVNDGEYLIPRLMRDQKRDAIEKPIGVGGAKVSPLRPPHRLQRLRGDGRHRVGFVPPRRRALRLAAGRAAPLRLSEDLQSPYRKRVGQPRDPPADPAGATPGDRRFRRRHREEGAGRLPQSRRHVRHARDGSGTGRADRGGPVAREPDARVPAKGPGRHASGNFQLSAFRLYQADPNDAGGLTPLPVESAMASFDYKASDADIAGTVNEKLKKVWHVWGRFGEPHQAVFSIRKSTGGGGAGGDRRIVIELRFKDIGDPLNLGHFRLSVSEAAAVLAAERRRLAAMNLTDPWAKLAAAYHLAGEQAAMGKLLEHHPTAVAGVGDVYAAEQDWGRAILEYGNAVAGQLPDGASSAKLAAAYQSAGRTIEAIPHLARASTTNPKDTLLSMQVAALQAWFEQGKELEATRQRILAFARGTAEVTTADRAAKSCSVLPSADKADLEAALRLGRTAVKLGNGGGDWNLLAQGMAEYRVGDDVAADASLSAAAEAGKNNLMVTGVASYFRSMVLFRQGKLDEARQLAVAAAATMKPLPADPRNPLAGGGTTDDLFVWLAYKEATAMLKINLSPIEALEQARADAAKTRGAGHPSTVAATQRLAEAYIAGGRTREAVKLLESASSATPKDTVLSLRVAALQAWFGQADAFAETRRRILASAKRTGDSGVAERAAKASSILPSTEKADLEAALSLGREGVRLNAGGGGWNLLAQGMAEYRGGDYAAADASLRAAAEAGKDTRTLAGIAAFYRAMSLSRQGKPDEARTLAADAAARMKPLPQSDENPLANDAYWDDLILWLAYKEFSGMSHQDTPPSNAQRNQE